MATVKEQIETLLAGAVDDNLQRTEDPLASGWEKPAGLSWLGSIGKATATGWATKATGEEIGALWTPEAISPTGFVVAATLGVNLAINNAILEIWGSTSKTKARGLLMSVRRTGASACTLELQREAASRETLKTKTSVNLAAGNIYAVSFFEGKLAGWLKKSGGSLEEILTVETTNAPESGEYSVLALFGNGSTAARVTNFVTGQLGAEETVYTEKGEGSFGATGSGTEALEASEAIAGTVGVEGSGSGGMEAIEAGGGIREPTGTEVDEHGWEEALNGAIEIAGSISESLEISEAPNGLIEVTGTATELGEFLEAIGGSMLLIGTKEEEYETEEEGSEVATYFLQPFGQYHPIVEEPSEEELGLFARMFDFFFGGKS